MRCLVFRSTAEAPTGVLRPEALTGARGQKASDPQASPATHPFHRRSPRSLPDTDERSTTLSTSGACPKSHSPRCATTLNSAAAERTTSQNEQTKRARQAFAEKERETPS
jgi:hypothetical protein